MPLQESKVAIVLAVAVLVMPVSAARASTIVTFDPGPVGSTSDSQEFLFDDLNGLVFDGSTLMVDFVFSNGNAIKVDFDPPVPDAELEVRVQLFHDGASSAAGPDDPSLVLGVIGAGGSPDVLETGSDLTRTAVTSPGDIRSARWASRDDPPVLVAGGYMYDRITMNVVLPDEGFVVTGARLTLEVVDEDAEPATLTVVPEPTSLALLALGGLLATRRRRSR